MQKTNQPMNLSEKLHLHAHLCSPAKTLHLPTTVMCLMPQLFYFSSSSVFYSLSWDNNNSVPRQVQCERATTPATLLMLFAKSCYLIDKLPTVSVTSLMQNRKSHLKPIFKTLLFIQSSSQFWFNKFKEIKKKYDKDDDVPESQGGTHTCLGHL